MSNRRTPLTASARVPTDLLEAATREAGRRSAKTGRHVTPTSVLAEWARAGFAIATSEPRKAA